MLPSPLKVSREERELHEVTHTPYRAWCQYCVKARGRNMPHKTREEERAQETVPRMVMDYFFMSKADERASENPMLVVVDEATGEKYARAVGSKGLGRDKEMDWLIKDISEELRSWGHPGGEGGHIILKSDGESAIAAVRNAVAKYHGGKVVLEKPPKGESKSNGTVEEAGKTVREFVRVFKEQVEDKAKIEVNTAENLMLWMIRWAAMTCSRYLVGKDGMTPFERRRGRKCRVPAVAFGEKVWYKELREGKDRKNKLASEWKQGAWLGHSRNSNEAVIGTPEGVVRAYAIKRMPEDSRWDGELLKNLKGTPQQPDPLKQGTHIPIRINFDPPASEEPVPVARDSEAGRIRRMMITPALLEKYGYTDGCDACRNRRAGLKERRGHSEICRTRIEEAMQQDEEGQRRRERDKERIDRRMAERIERESEAAEKSVAQAEDMPRAAQESGEPEQDEGGQAEAPMALEEAGRKRDQPAGGVEEPGKRRRRDASSGSGSAQEDQRRPTQDVEEHTERVTSSTSGEGDAEMTEIVGQLLRLSVDIAEMYCPPRVTTEAKKFGLDIGEAMDLTTGWDFSKAEDKDRAWAYLESHRPKLVIGSPMCTMYSALQNLTPWTPEKTRRWREDRQHLQFMCQVYAWQANRGAWFLHEHPASASSWSLAEMRQVAQMPGVAMSVADQCMYGLMTWGQNGREWKSARKRTRFMSNSQEILKELGRQCNGQHEHQHLKGKRAELAARYPPGLCRAICTGLIREMKVNTLGLKKLMDVGPRTTVAGPRPAEEEDDWDWAQAWDDVTGEQLDPAEVRRARAKEMNYVQEKKVWAKIPRTEAERNGWKIIQTRWIDINKGNAEEPNYRSRLVGKEFNDGQHYKGLFAATPPLEALRLLISEAATVKKGKVKGDKVIMVNDVARAFFEAPMRRTVCVELPAEALTEAEREQGVVGLLQMSLYGTRDAAANFQEEVRKVMIELGFRQSRFSPSIYYHPQYDLMTLVHGDDFITAGGRAECQWMRRRLERRFEIKSKVIGAGAGESQEERVLNRVIRCTPQGWEYEADQRHAELIVKDVGMEDAKGVKGPGEDDKPWEVEENAKEVPDREGRWFRELAARANYLAMDRSDIQYPVKEICRGMARPTKGHIKKLRRLARYLKAVPRVVWHFRFQGECEELSSYGDSDWAGCKRTARSTSGGAVLRGGHCLKTWSVTQKNVTLSSAEAELMAAVKLASESIGIAQLAESWGLKLDCSLYLDSSAALAVVERKGNGKLRHVRVGHLWIQERAESEEISCHKVRGEANPADLMTKYLTPSRVTTLSEALHQTAREGRARASLTLNRLAFHHFPWSGGGHQVAEGECKAGRAHIML